MANNRSTYQQVRNVSIPKKELLELVVYNEELTKKDLRVCLFLFTVLDGWKEPERYTQDPNNFTVVYDDVIARDLGMSKKDVRKSLRTLLREGIIEEGDGKGNEDGLRFTF